MIGQPGSTLWLLAHELRLGWRRMMSRKGRRRWAGAGLWLTLGVPVVLTLLSIPMGLAFRKIDDIPVIPMSVIPAAAGLAMVFTLMLSQTLAAAVDALYERNDLDLLFSSPLRPARVMTVRFLGVALSVFSFFGYFLAGPLIVVAVMGHPAWLGTLAVLAALALGASGTGLLIAVGLFRVIGPKRTQAIAQVLAAVIGAAFFLLAQARNILGARSSGDMWRTMAERTQAPGYHLPPGLDWPLRALIGQPVPLLTVVAVGVGLFWLANAWLGPRFAADAAAAAGAGLGGRGSAGRMKAFASGAFAATLRKEWRLLVRDPALLTQVLLRVLYMLPLGFVLLRRAGEHDDLLLPGAAAALALMASQVAGSLAWITISAEDAPDLLACAPAEIALVRRGKMAAAALPVAALLAPFLIPLLVLEPGVAAAAIAGCAGAVLSSVLMNLWWQRPGKRAEFRNRRGRGASWFVTLAEFFVGLLIAGATGLFAAGLVWGLVPAAVAALALVLMRRSDAQISESLRLAAVNA